MLGLDEISPDKHGDKLSLGAADMKENRPMSARGSAKSRRSKFSSRRSVSHSQLLGNVGLKNKSNNSGKSKASKASNRSSKSKKSKSSRIRKPY